MCGTRASVCRVVHLLLVATLCVAQSVPNGRPQPSQRRFNSTAVNAAIAEIKGKMKDPALATIFENCYPNTLDTTVLATSANDTYVITGDINAMWLRDSTNQVLPYMQFARNDPDLKRMLRGVVLRQLRSVLIDVYANAFNQVANGDGHQKDKRTPPMTPAVHEGKYELDSLAAVMKLVYHYWNATQDTTILDDLWMTAMERILDTITVQQKSTAEDGAHPAYTFDRPILEKYPREPANRCGLSKCGFRPSDDETHWPFLVPANAMTIVELRHTVQVASAVNSSRAAAIAEAAATLASQLQLGMGITVAEKDRFGQIFSYEVDGFGHQSTWDDANVPSLLSLPYLGYVAKNDPIYLNTRHFLLSDANSHYFVGKVAKGIGSPHTPHGYIWPMSLILQALTSDDDAEIAECLGYVRASALQTGFMHESFDCNNATKFTRPWFAWANSLFGELILTLARERPHLIFAS